MACALARTKIEFNRAQFLDVPGKVIVFDFAPLRFERSVNSITENVKGKTGF
jgi:hypothetical protein